MDTRKLGLDPEIAAQELLEKGKVATTPMKNWGSERASPTCASSLPMNPLFAANGSGRPGRPEQGTVTRSCKGCATESIGRQLSLRAFFASNML
jgi:hypothetical protein